MVESMHDIEALDGLAAGSFSEVVLGGHEDYAVGAWVGFVADIDEVGAGDLLGISGFPFSEKPDECGIGVSFFEGGSDLFGGDTFAEFCLRDVADRLEVVVTDIFVVGTVSMDVNEAREGVLAFGIKCGVSCREFFASLVDCGNYTICDGDRTIFNLYIW